MELKNKYILDACCGGRMLWFNKKHPNTIYIDNRIAEKGHIDHRPNHEVKPDVVMNFTNLEFKDKSFKLVVFDPPHLKTLGKNSRFAKTYGSLNAETWQYDLNKGFNECWRVLEDYGILIFKWNEEEISSDTVLSLFLEKPLFGHTTGSKSKTKWFCFMKIPIANGGTNFTKSSADDFPYQESLIADKQNPHDIPKITQESYVKQKAD